MDTPESKTRRDSANSGRWMTGVDAIPAYRPWASKRSSEPYDPKEQARLTEELFGPMTPEKKARLDRWDD